MVEDRYSVEELAGRLNISSRRIHFWVQSGLLDGPGAGPGSRYTDEHLGKLFLIQKLRSEQRSLAEIRRALQREPKATFLALAEQAKAAVPAPDINAAQLVRQLLAESGPPAVSAASGAPAVLGEPAPLRFTARQSPDGWESNALYERKPLAPGVELHVQHPLSRASRKLVDQLIALARRSSKEHSS